MRLQLGGAARRGALFAAAGLAAGRTARAADERDPGDGRATARLGVYSDDDATRVVTTLVDGDVALPQSLDVGAHVLVDAISSASVDVVSAATGRWDENRVEVGGRLARARGPGGVDLGIAAVHSRENDWSSWSAQASAGRDFARRNTRLDLGVGHVRNHVGRASDANFEESLASTTVEVGVTQVVGARTVAGATYLFQASDGYHASPYRFVRTADERFTFPEMHPDARRRHAATGRLLRGLMPRLGWDTSYRLYFDDWGVRSHTGQSALVWEAARRWDLRARGRFYYQSAASFYRQDYDFPARYMTADRELTTFWDAGGGIQAAWSPGPLTADVKLDATHYRFLDFDPLPSRLAVVVEAGVGARW